MSEHQSPPEQFPPPTISAEPFLLDDITFTPNSAGLIERATRSDNYIGDVLLDVVVTPGPDGKPQVAHYWFARKFDVAGDLSDWKHMRCVHEARAFLVSKIRQ